jgi:hypothetical protein
VALAARAGNVMLGICAADTAGAVAALKAWTTGLGLPRRLLHGLDTAGKPVTIDGCARGLAHALPQRAWLTRLWAVALRLGRCSSSTTA